MAALLIADSLRSGRVEIRTERLVLRKPEAGDLAAVVAACRDPEIGRFIPYVPVPYDEDGRAVREPDGPLLGAVTGRLREGGTVG
jgi:hypothetical protein